MVVAEALDFTRLGYATTPPLFVALDQTIAQLQIAAVLEEPATVRSPQRRLCWGIYDALLRVLAFP